MSTKRTYTARYFCDLCGTELAGSREQPVRKLYGNKGHTPLMEDYYIVDIGPECMGKPVSAVFGALERMRRGD